MAERKTKPAAKKAAVTGTAGRSAVKPKTAKTAVTASKKTPVKKAATAAAKPKTAKSPAVKKTAAPAAAKKAPAKKAAAAKAKTVPGKVRAQVSPEERYRMVQTAAYFIAEHNGFCGDSTEHWAAAEIEIASRLGY